MINVYKIKLESVDIDASAYSGTLNAPDSPFYFTGLFLKFSTAASRDVYLILTDGTTEITLKSWIANTNTSIVFVPDKDWIIPQDWSVKLTISDPGSACVVDGILVGAIK